MAHKRTSDYILGVAVTARALHAVLLEAADGEERVLRYFSRPRSHTSAASDAPPEVQGDGAADPGRDFTLRIGGDGSSEAPELFLGSEFGPLEAVPEENVWEAVSLEPYAEGDAGTPAFGAELHEVLEACREAGYARPRIACALGVADTVQAELNLSEPAAPPKPPGLWHRLRAGRAPAADGSRRGVPSRKHLLALLEARWLRPADPERVVFVPMTPASGEAARFLALFPTREDPVTATLAALEEQGPGGPPVCLLDTEVTLYLGLIRAVQQAGPDPEPAASERASNTLLVRVGAEDTLVLLLQGHWLRHAEVMPSLTAFDAPEAVCGRVLLLLDEHGISQVQHVLLLSEQHEEELVESFTLYFPEAHVERLQQRLPREADEPPPGSAAWMPALGAALRLVRDTRYREAFEPVNFLPKRLRRRARLPLSLPTLVAGALLLTTALYFFARITGLQREQAHYREQLQRYAPASAYQDTRGVQTRIDSLHRATRQYTGQLRALDSLLEGSDRWSRLLEHLSRETAAVKGLWVEEWRPRETHVVLAGTATQRASVVHLAEHLHGVLGSLTSAEIRGRPVYRYTLDVPLEKALPEAVQYLRDRMARDEQEEAAPAASATRRMKSIDPARGGWTVVVASARQRERLEPLVARYRGRFEDYPVGLFSGTVDGVTRYRVGVGQFPSLAAARPMLARLRADATPDAWMLKVRPGL